jgi:hypothetical protein
MYHYNAASVHVLTIFRWVAGKWANFHVDPLKIRRLLKLGPHIDMEP